MNLTNEEIGKMAREYHAEYKNGADVHEAMDAVLERNQIPEGIRGTVAGKIRDYKPAIKVRIPLQVKFGGAERIGRFAEASLPTGDRD